MSVDFINAKIMVSVFAYDRPEFLSPCLQSIKEASDSNVETVIFVDDSGSCSGVDRIVDASGFRVVRPPERLGGFYPRYALELFLHDRQTGDILISTDGDMLLGRETFAFIREFFRFWWASGLEVGMLCGGIRYNNIREPRVERSGRKVIKNNGAEAFCVFPRPALERAYSRYAIQNTANLKNAMMWNMQPRALSADPALPVAHVGAFKSTRNPATSIRHQLFLDGEGNPLNPRPDLFDIQKELEALGF